MSTTLVPQVLGKSCWAASLEMFTEGQLRQCDLLKTDFSPGDPTQAPDFCDPIWQEANRGRYTGNTRTLDEVDAELHRDANNPIPTTVVDRTPSFADLQNNIKTSAITLFSWDTDGDLHFVVPTKTIAQRLTTRDVLQWIKVFDPFPVVEGRTYYLNYKEFSSDDWFKGIIYHGPKPTTTDPAPLDFSGVNPKKLVQKYIDSLPATIASDFRQVTRITATHRILDYEFNVTNTGVDILINDSDSFFDEILALARDMKMYLTESRNKYTSFFLNSEGSKYYISAIENGLKYLPVLSNDLAGTVDLTMIAAQSRAVHQPEGKDPEKPGGIEEGFIKYFEKNQRTALICRFFDIGQEYVFFLRNGRVRVFDPFKSFAYILPKDHEKTTHLSIKEFLSALTQFYPILNKK